MGKPAHFSTKERILAAAEELFAQHGFAGTSLRQVTSQAAVNIAAVNYHFGSKENLINEVFRRRMDVMTAQRLQQLEAALRDHPGQLEPILAAFIDPALALAQDRNGGAAFVRLIARAYAEHNESLRRFLSDHYGHVLREFGKALAAVLPGLDKETADLDAALGRLAVLQPVDRGDPFGTADLGRFDRRGAGAACHEQGATEQEQEPIRPPHGLRPAAPALPGPGCAGTRPAGASGP